MRSQNRKVNNVGRAGCLGLLALGLALVNPMSCLSAFAEVDDGESNGNEITPGVVSSEKNYDDQIMTTAATASMVNISFSPSSASGSVTPIDSTIGDKAKVDVQATVRVQNSGGYSVYVGSNSSQLKNGNNVIDSVTSATTYANLPLNRWGYSFRKASSATDKTVADSYVAMPATLRSTALDSNTSNNVKDETRYYMLSFAARIGADRPTGTYSNNVTFSVVSSPLETVTFASQGITTMQEMTSAICDTVSVGQEAQLKDTRDNKFYWVGKLADGRCWMTQNLDLDLSTSKALTSASSDVSSNWTPGFTTATSAKTSPPTSSSYIETRSWSLGDYRITNPNTSSYCGTKKDSPADCPNQFTTYATPTSANGDANAHYSIGNYYQWNAATAGTGGSITTGQAKSSICPKGWRLPIGGSTTGSSSGEFVALVTALGGTRPMNYVTEAPFYGVMGGYVGTGGFNEGGSEGHYVSSVPISGSGDADAFASSLFIYGTSNYIAPSTTNWRYTGSSVRCVAR